MGRDLRIWCVFGLSIVGVSSAGSLLASMDAIPPLLRACWRLQATVLVLVPGFVIQWRGAAPEIRARYLQRRHQVDAASVDSWHCICAWVASVDRTSLQFFVTAHPVLLVTGMIRSTYGSLVPSSDRSSDCRRGDHVARLDRGAGGHPDRRWACARRGCRCDRLLPDRQETTSLDAVVPLCYARDRRCDGDVADRVRVDRTQRHRRCRCVRLVGSGMGGHGLSPRHRCWSHRAYGIERQSPSQDPLIVSVGVTLEPVLGVLIDRLLFATEWPGPWTVLGGTILLIGLVLVARNEPTGRGSDSTSSEA